MTDRPANSASAPDSTRGDTARALDAFRDTVHVPADAGEHAAGLERILRRIPKGWGRWISCDPGWYPLIVQLDNDIAALLPDYQVHQVKEKFGGLRYYIGLPELRPACCEERERTDPRPVEGAISGPWVPKDRSSDDQARAEAWLARQLAHLKTPAHRDADQAIQNGPEAQRRSSVAAQVRALIDAAEAAAARTCERCSAPGERRQNNMWLKTLCEPCAADLGYLDTDDDTDDGDTDDGDTD